MVWYSSTTAKDALALIKRFNEQHPSIQIQHLRSSSEKLLERILAEARANAFKADIVTLPELELSIMIKRKQLARYEDLENSIYPAEAKDPGGYWTGLYTSALFYDFLLSRSGMETIRASRRIPDPTGCDRDLSEAIQAFTLRAVGDG